MGRGEQLEGRRKGWAKEVMEQKHIKLQSWGQDSQQSEENTPTNTNKMAQPTWESSIQLAAQGSTSIWQYTI